ncbi:hypothetical protein FACS1894204_07110 [Synergistales bacterium]|nr:hypothetical protein FACS1894204_07110 [Synergistales bacterium]
MESKQYLVDIYRRYFESFIPYSAMLFMYKMGAFPFLKRRISEIFTYYETEKRQNGGIGSDLEEVLT